MLVKFNRYLILLSLMVAGSIYSQGDQIQDNRMNYDIDNQRQNHGINGIVLNHEMALPQNPVEADGVVGLVQQILRDADPVEALRNAIAAGHETELMNFTNRRLIDTGQINREGHLIHYPDNRMMQEFLNRDHGNGETHNFDNNINEFRDSNNHPENNHP